MDGLAASPASEAPFRISFSGHRGHLRLDPNTPNPGPDFLLLRSRRPAYVRAARMRTYLEANYLSPKLYILTAANDAKVWGCGLVWTWPGRLWSPPPMVSWMPGLERQRLCEGESE
nr:uncharacterized protein LOC127309397 [Lolium perenne]